MLPLRQARAYEPGEVRGREGVDGQRANIGGTGEPALVPQHPEDQAALGEGGQDALAERPLGQREQLRIQAWHREDVRERVVGGAEDDVAARGEVAERSHDEAIVEAGHVG